MPYRSPHVTGITGRPGVENLDIDRRSIVITAHPPIIHRGEPFVGGPKQAVPALCRRPARSPQRGPAELHPIAITAEGITAGAEPPASAALVPVAASVPASPAPDSGYDQRPRRPVCQSVF